MLITFYLIFKVFKTPRSRLGAWSFLSLIMYRVVCFHFQSYLESTLQSVFDNMSEEEVNEVLVVVFIAELDQEYVARIAAQVRNGSLIVFL